MIVAALRIIWAVWNEGNYWARYVILTMLFFPVVIAAISLFGSFVLTSLVALVLPVVAIIALFWFWRDPLILAVLAGFPWGRQILRFAAWMLAAEIGIGIIFSAVPIANNRGFIPLYCLVLLFYSILVITNGNKKLRWHAGTTAIIITLLFYIPDIASAVAYRLNLKQKSVAVGIRTNGFSGLSNLLPARHASVDTNPPTAILMPADQADLWIPENYGYYKIPLTVTNQFSGWIHVPHRWGWVDLWPDGTNGYWVQYLGENQPRYMNPSGTNVLRYGPFKVAGEGGFFYLKRKT